MGKNITVLNDPSDHGGKVVNAGQSTVTVNGIAVAINGLAMHSCPIQGHGVTPITAITTKSYIAGKLIITKGAKAGCGATITSPDRKVYIE
jgi:uncharacterized Zn-binding protein involved in type VI secretion